MAEPLRAENMQKSPLKAYKMLPGVHYVWVGASCDYGHEERASAGAYLLQRENETIGSYVTSSFRTTEFRMILTVMIRAMEVLPEQSKIVFLTNVSYIQNFDKAPADRANDTDSPAVRANDDLIRTCIRLKARHAEVQVKLVPYHKYPELPRTHEMAHEAMMELRKMK